MTAVAPTVPLTERPPCLPRERLMEPYNGWREPELGPCPALALCESAAQVAWLAGGERPRHEALVALTPQAACECRLRGVPYLKLEDFYDASAFLAADEPMLALEAAWADAIDAFAWDAVPELAAAHLRPAGHCFLQLKILIDRLYQAAFGLAHLLLAAGPGARVVHFEAAPARSVPDTLFFGDPPHSAVAAVAAAEYGADAAALPPRRERRRQPLRERGLRGALEAVLGERLVGELAALRTAGPAALRSRSRAGVPEIVYQTRGYDLEQLVEQLTANGYRAVSLRELVPPRPLAGRGLEIRLRRSLEQLWPELSEAGFFAEPFRWAGLDLRPLAESRLRHWWLRLVPALWRAFVRATARFAVRRPHALLLYSPVTPQEYGALQAARAAGIPTFTYQHGGFEGSCEYIIYEMTDLRLADHRLVYGDGVAEYMRERAARLPQPARVASVGSARLDAMGPRPERRAEIRRRLGLGEDEQVVLYLPCSYQHASWYMCRGTYLAVPYFELLAGVVETLGRFPGLRFLYKPFPEQPLDPVVRLIECGAPNVSVVRDVRAPELFDACDALVIDIPSTGLLEALLTRKRMLVHADSRFITLRPEARELLRKRVELSETPEELLGKLDAFLAADLSELDEPDDSFLRAYGTHLGDGRAAERAADAVIEIAATHPPAAPTAWR